MRAILSALAILAVAPASAAGDSQEALTRCYARQAVTLDDGMSDARSIATALLAPCRSEREAVLRDGMPKASTTEIERAMLMQREIVLDRATAVVLQVRIDQKKRRQP
ncbi:hypothetical protein SAMN04515666_101337 [Bosea lupini]|uniref:UrcA family protein n=1 Tax=Bosea lupini TaxID=1036779 RepID=A0A1H7GGS3_9HYPH|nr:hypothetical protein [Bosea lupini]SEK36717.1 hypothetical protein SAMN04515666_101337 [Bosea lupini]